jgi:DNA-directed RNA polymerase specialized sigma24 family protein
VSNEAAELEERDRADMVGSPLNDLMERHASKLFNHLARGLPDENDAADLAQETFVRVFQNCMKFDARIKFSTWLYAIGGILKCSVKAGETRLYRA